MSGPENSDSAPPEVPEEFAAAYRAAYERAMASQSVQTHRRPDHEEAAEVEALPARSSSISVGTHRAPYQEESPERTSVRDLRESRWFVPVLLALLALLLVLGAYAVGRVFAGQVEPDGPPAAEPTVKLSEGSQSPSAKPKPQSTPSASPWDGPVEAVAGVNARVGCTTRPGVDASGDRVDYVAANMVDADPETTWRCDGTAIGQRITLRLGAKTSIGELGLIPGYAKTDPKSKDDRYAENNRITRVRWTFGGVVVEQSMNGSSQDRSLRLIRVPRTSARTIVLEILAVEKGPRNTTAISEVRVSAAG